MSTNEIVQYMPIRYQGEVVMNVFGEPMRFPIIVPRPKPKRRDRKGDML